KGLLLFDDPAHAVFDVAQVALAQRLVAEIEVVVKAELHRRAKGHLYRGPHFDHGLRQNVRQRMAKPVKEALLFVCDAAHVQGAFQVNRMRHVTRSYAHVTQGRSGTGGESTEMP